MPADSPLQMVMQLGHDLERQLRDDPHSKAPTAQALEIRAKKGLTAPLAQVLLFASLGVFIGKTNEVLFGDKHDNGGRLSSVWSPGGGFGSGNATQFKIYENPSRRMKLLFSDAREKVPSSVNLSLGGLSDFYGYAHLMKVTRNEFIPAADTSVMRDDLHGRSDPLAYLLESGYSTAFNASYAVSEVVPRVPAILELGLTPQQIAQAVTNSPMIGRLAGLAGPQLDAAWRVLTGCNADCFEQGKGEHGGSLNPTHMMDKSEIGPGRRFADIDEWRRSHSHDERFLPTLWTVEFVDGRLIADVPDLMTMSDPMTNLRLDNIGGGPSRLPIGCPAHLNGFMWRVPRWYVNATYRANTFGLVVPETELHVPPGDGSVPTNGPNEGLLLL